MKIQQTVLRGHHMGSKVTVMTRTAQWHCLHLLWGHCAFCLCGSSTPTWTFCIKFQADFLEVHELLRYSTAALWKGQLLSTSWQVKHGEILFTSTLSHCPCWPIRHSLQSPASILSGHTKSASLLSLMSKVKCLRVAWQVEILLKSSLIHICGEEAGREGETRKAAVEKEHPLISFLWC